MNKKASSWWAWFFVILFILVMTSVVRNSMIRHSMYDDITGNVINEKNYGKSQTQQEQVTKQQETYPKQPEKNTQTNNQQISDNEQIREQSNQEEKCKGGYSDEYKCDGKTIRRKWINSDCSFDWLYYLACYYGCENGECKEKPEEETKSCNYGYLEEYKCNDDDIQKKYQHSNCSFSWVFNELCSYGCENANCKPCEDTDNGKDYHTKGYIYYSVKGKVYDECDSNIGYENYLIEYYCKNSKLDSEYYKCPYGCSDGKCNPEPQIMGVAVSYVSDGDTLKLSTGESVRLIGLNAPESGQSCSSEATAKLKEFVLGKEVTLEQDVSDKDQYSRLLRYVYVDNTFVNLEMVRLGLAHKYEYGSNTKYSSQFEQAEDEAKQNEGCLWKTSQESYINDQCIYITNFHFNAAGDDNYNVNDEYVIFGNKCSYSIEMTGWTIKDETASHLYTIPSFIFQSGATFTLYTGTGTNTNSALYWGRTSGNYAAIWNTGGDTLFLRDSNGNLVLSQSYSGY